MQNRLPESRQQKTPQIIRELNRRALEMKEVSELRKLNDFIPEKRKQIAEKYDYRYPVPTLALRRSATKFWAPENN